MNALFNRWLPAFTLAAWSAILLSFHFSGRTTDLLIPMFRPYVFLAGIVLGVMSLVFVFFNADASGCSAAECGQSFSRLALGKILTFLVLLLPISAAAVYSPKGFGKTAMENRGVITDATSLGGGPRVIQPSAEMPLPTKESEPGASAEVSSGTPPPADQPLSDSSQPTAPADYLSRTPEGYIVAEVLDLLYAAQDNMLRKDFENKTVQLIGQYMPDKSSPNRFKAVRMFMTCCAADARPVATLVEVDKLPDVPEMTWVKVTAESTFPLENGRRVSVLKAKTVEKSEPPEETMLY